METLNHIGKNVHDIQTPAFLVDIQIFKNNCLTMLDRTEKMGIQLRGQTKTHKTIEGALIQTNCKRRCIVTSTLKESEFYADAGFEDILLGYPLMPVHMDRNFHLTKRLKKYHVMITNKESIETLCGRSPPTGKKWSVFIMISCGYEREGFCWNENEYVEVANIIMKHKETINLQGLYVHCGNSYNADTARQVQEVRDGTIDALLFVKEKLEKEGIHIIDLGIGSTPTCSHQSEKLSNLTEIHPGNYVFYDIQQFLGHPHLSLIRMTQEIGIVQPREKGKSLDFQNFPVGSILFLLPYHSCATAALHPVYYVHENNVIVDEWAPVRGW